MVRKLLITLSVAIALALAAAYLGGIVHPSMFWPFAMAALIGPWLMFANVLAMAFWWVKKSKLVFIPLVIILPCLPRMADTLAISGGQRVESEEDLLTVTTLNVCQLDTRHRNKDRLGKIDVESLRQLTRSDILFLQESPGKHFQNNAILATLANQLQWPYQLKLPYHDIALLSAFPVRLIAQKEFRAGVNGYQVADLDFRGQTIRLINVHLQSNAISGLAGRVVNSGDLRRRRTWRYIVRIFKHYRNAAIHRAEQAQELSELISESPHPVILGGDLNDVSFSYTYQLLTKALDDSYIRGGHGLGPTYAGRIPFLRIDYLLSSRDFRTIDSHVIRAPYSDHNALQSRFLLR